MYQKLASMRQEMHPQKITISFIVLRVNLIIYLASKQDGWQKQQNQVLDIDCFYSINTSPR